jgi:hypothetical protein
MFLNNTTHKDTQKLKEELQVFGLHESSIQSKNILGDFFFIHENKSTTEGDSENLNFEFLHKTFGEFLAADFLLRIAFKQTQKSREKIYQQYIFKFCFGYNWLNKHQNIQNFLFEYAPQFKAENKDITRIIEDIIKPDLEALFKNGNLEFPVKENQILPHKEVVEHLGIYSQNLIFLWLAISNDAEVTFEIFGTNEKTGDGTSEPKYESQDRDETNKNKLLWKRFAKLWTLVGNYNATAKLHEWIKVVERDNNIILSKSKADVSHNFSDSAKVACNDFELLLSFFDNEYKFSKENLKLDNLEIILKNKPELTSLAIDAFLHRFHDLFSIYDFQLLEWFRGKEKELSKRQQISLMRKIAGLKWQVSTNGLTEIVRFITKDMIFVYRENPQATIEYLKILIDLKVHHPLERIFNPEILDDLFHGLSRDIGYIDRDNPFATLEYIKLLNELNRHYPFRRKFKGDFLEESLHRISKEMHHILRENPYSSFEYLKLLNELRKYYPIGKRIHSEFFEETLHMLSKDISFIARENPHVILEYLKLIYDLSKHFPTREKIPYELFEDSVRFLSQEWVHVIRDESFNFIEFLKIIIELRQFYPIEKLIPFELVEESLQRVSHDLVYLIRDNPKEAYVYLNLLKELQNYFLDKGDMRHKRGNIFEETLHRLSKEVDNEFRGNSAATLIYLEIALMSLRNYRFKEEGQLLDRLVETLVLRDFNSRIVKKALFLLMKYDADPRLIERLLEQNPKLQHIYLNAPEIARDIVEAMTEFDSNERNN